MDYINRWLGSELLMFCILPWGYAAAVALLLILMFSKKTQPTDFAVGITTTVGSRGIAVTHVAVHPVVEPNRHGMDVDAPVADSELGGLAARAAAGNLAAQAVARMAAVPYCVHWGAVPGDAGAVACY